MVGRVVIVSASVGRGHDDAAIELGRRLVRAGCEVKRVDFLDLMPGRLGAGLRALYRRQLAVAPVSWQWMLDTLARVDVLAARPLSDCVGSLAERCAK